MDMFEIRMPKLGESIEQATITRWFVSEGDAVAEDDPLLEIATDKVDSEIPSPVAGVVAKILFPQDALVAVGAVVALIDTSASAPTPPAAEPDATAGPSGSPPPQSLPEPTAPPGPAPGPANRYYTPLVRSIARHEGVSPDELQALAGTGSNGRVTKADILAYIARRGAPQGADGEPPPTPMVHPSLGAHDTLVQMDRTRRLIAEHMVRSQEVAAHVTTMVEADVTELVRWRERVKGVFEQKYSVKLTYMPMFTEAAARALRDFPMVNASVQGDAVLLRGRVNIGIAVARPDGNLIVPVVRDADRLNLVGLAEAINALAAAAREGKLAPDDVQGGTFSITNFGTFRNLMGTPIIAQPQVAILATGSIEKRPAVMETPYGDVIVPRHKMFLSLSYDHRIIDGALGGAFLRRVADYLEQFDVKREG